MLTVEWTTPSGALNAVIFDAEISSKHESSAEVTDHAVERGQDVSDRVRPNPDTVSIEAMVTNTPLAAPPSQAEGITASFQAVQLVAEGRQISVTVLRFSERFDRARSVDAVMRALQKSGTLVRIHTSLRDYEDMAITRFTADRDAATASALPVVLEARAVRLVDTQLVQVPEPVERRGRTRRDRGGQAATETRRQSVLARGLDAIGGLLD